MGWRGHVNWCRRFVEERRREAEMRRAAGLAAPKDSAALVYTRETAKWGLCVVEWRGQVPPVFFTRRAVNEQELEARFS